MVDEKRKNLRLPLQSRLFIELVGSDPGDTEPAEIVSCQTLDVSRGGVQVALDRALTAGAILQLGVDMPDSERTLYLAGEVRWCRRISNIRDHWSAGLKLLNTGDADFISWVGFVSEMDS